ncbi:MAG: hypothetical protein JW715_03195 [Sedimentisphaerales bacterium]|nr:hypothetical protein [Sedimentisphaerales bacterium]
MESAKKSQTKRKKKTGRRIIQIAAALVVILILFVLLAVPALISSEKGRQIILAKINKSIDGKTDFSDLSMGWFKGIKVADLSFDDTAGQFSLKVRQIATEPHYGSLLIGNLSFGKTVIDEPRIEINLKNKPPAEAVAATESEKVPKEAAGIALVTDIVVNDGSVKVTGTDNKTVELAQINSNVNLRPAGKQSSFDLNMIVVANDKESKVQAGGKITPAETKGKSGWSLKDADCDVTVQVNDLDIESLESFFALAGIDIQAKGNISMNVQGRLTNGQLENVTGTVNGKNLDITAAGLKGDRIKSNVLDADLKLIRKDQLLNVEKLNVKTDWAALSGTGSVPTTIKSLDSLLAPDSNYDLNGTFNCNIASLASQIPNTMGLKEGMMVSSGIINGTIKTAMQAGKKQIQAQAELTNLKGVVEGKEITLSQPLRAQAKISPDKSGTNIDTLSVTAPFAKIDCSGNMESIKYIVSANLAQLQSELGQFINIGPYQMAGGLASQGTVSITEQKISAKGSAGIENLRLSSQEKGSVSESKADIAFALNLDRNKNILNADSIQADTGFGRINVKNAMVQLNKDWMKSLNATVQANKLDLGKLKPYAVMFASLPKETQLAGIAEAEVKVTSENNSLHIVTENTNIKNIEFASPGKKPFKQPNTSIVADIEYNPVDITYSGKLNLLSDQINVLINISNKKTKNQKSELKGNAELQYDWSALNAIAGSYLPENLVIEGKRKDTINFTSEYPTDEPNQLMPNLKSNAALGFQKAEYKGLNFGPTNVNIDVNNGLLNIAQFETIVNEGQFNFGAQADFKVQPTVFKTPAPMHIIKDIKINDQVTKKLLKYINPIFADAANVNGIANLNCEKLSIPLSDEAKNKAEIVGIFSVDQLRLETSDVLGQILTVLGGSPRGTVITIHPTRFELRNGFLRYDNMQMDIGDNPVNFTGIIGLDKSLDMSVTLPYTSEGKTIRIGNTSARRITLKFTGTVDNPKLDVGKLLEDQLKQELENQIIKGLENIFG